MRTSFLAGLKNEYAPADDLWLVTSKAFAIENIDAGEWEVEVERLSKGQDNRAHPALQIRAGGPALTLFVGWDYQEGGDDIALTAVLALHERSKESTGTPLPPLAIRDASTFDVEWGSEASLKEAKAWLASTVGPIFLGGLDQLNDLAAGRSNR